MTEPPAPPREITLPMVFTAVMDFRAEVIEALERQRADLAEGQSLLFQQNEVHRKRLDEHDTEIGELKNDTADHDDQIRLLRKRYHDLSNKLQPVFTAYEEFGRRLDALERFNRKDTVIAPPPETTEVMLPPPADGGG